ncbi:RagB/SusD family nutrient uptake outer membrane protein [Chitinophaga sp. NPDC101104]|uniref:RagB/SusD family nutrient uptake outer membrane protein n=1 Tax=Chitinophaga sp. NPDC101104 TaxID=3390561 RepID=UPI003D050206
MKKLLVILLAACSLASCKKFLEEYSPSDVTPKSTADFNEILFSDGYPDAKKELHPWLMYMEDDIQFYVSPANMIDAPTYYAAIRGAYEWQSVQGRDGSGASPEYFNAWGNYYKQLLGVNVVLQNVDRSTGDPALKDQVKGEAYALRAYYHFKLVNIYARPYNDSTTTPGKLAGIPLRTNGDLSDQYMTRNTVKEVYDQITSDLDSAILLLERSRKTDDVFRISHVAAHLLASRVYLYMEDWQRCIQHADAVLHQHPQLMNYMDWNGVTPDFDNSFVGPENVESVWCYGSAREYYPMNEAGFGMCFEVSRELVGCFEDNDLRKANVIFEVPVELKPYIGLDYFQNKRMYPSGANEYLTINNSWRSSEAYLNRAEAYIQLYRTKGDAAAASEALKSLNTLRAQRFAPADFQAWTLKPADILLQMCRDERRRELYFEEGHRWFDLKRYGMPSIRHVYHPDLSTTQTFTLQKRDAQYVVPIPEIVLTRNPALVRDPLIPGTRQPD